MNRLQGAVVEKLAIMYNLRWCLVSMLGQDPVWCLHVPVDFPNNDRAVLENLAQRALSGACSEYADHGSFAVAGTPTNDLIGGLLTMKPGYLQPGRVRDYWVRQSGTFFPCLDSDVIVRESVGMYPPFPQGGVIVCENDPAISKYLRQDAERAFPGLEINVMGNFRYRHKWELERAFKYSKGVFFKSSLVSMDWWQMLLAAWKGTYLPIKGMTSNDEGWNIAMNLAKTCGADYYIERIPMK